MLPLVILALLVVGGAVIYNGLIRLRTQADAAWADIDVQLKRRHDLVPNLVETVKGYVGHERGTLEAVVQARNQAMSAEGPAASARAEGMLAGALKSLFALSEAYPELQAADGFLRLHESLDELENEIQNARRYYNAVVRDYNTRIQQIPSNFVALSFRFREREFFELDEPERALPRVSFGDDGP